MKAIIKLKTKICKLIDKEIEKEKDKYLSGLANDYFSLEDEAVELKDVIFRGYDELKKDYQELLIAYKKLENKYYGRE